MTATVLPSKRSRGNYWTSLGGPSGDAILSTQVLQEFYVTVTRKIKRPLAPELAVALDGPVPGCSRSVATDYPLIVSAVELSLRYGVAYWDGAILAAAEALEAKVLYTEDLSHGQLYGSVRAVNPFLEA